MNPGEQERKTILRFHEKIAEYRIPAHSIVTFVF